MQLFASAANILWRIGGDPQIIKEFMQLAGKAKAAASEAMDAEAILGDIPDEFLDPIQVQYFRLCRRFSICWSMLTSPDFISSHNSIHSTHDMSCS